MSNGAGKGDCPRPYNREKWEAGWAAYEKGKKNEDKLKETEEDEQS